MILFIASLRIVSLVFLLTVMSICGYYYFLAVFGLVLRWRGESHGTTVDSPHRHSFAIVIPAHNEEAVVQTALSSCHELDYDKDKYQVYVIADNCSDQTAVVAERHGARALTRQDEINRGKGHALQWAFERILPEGHDALIVLDADCRLDAHALRVLDGKITGGAEVLQTSDDVSNPDESPISFALAVGNVIENQLFYWSKSELGLSVLLRGTGMVFTRDILTRYRWSAQTIVEDAEYAITLMKNRVRTVFVEDVKVASSFPVNEEQLDIQRKRWASGNMNFGKYQSLTLIFQGIRDRNLMLVDAGWTFLVLYRPLVLFAYVITLLLTATLCFFDPGLLSTTLMTVTLILGLSLTVYFLSGIWLLGISWSRILLLLKTPVVIVRLIVISVLGLMGVDKELWAKTPR